MASQNSLARSAESESVNDIQVAILIEPVLANTSDKPRNVTWLINFQQSLTTLLVSGRVKTITRHE